MKRKPIETRLIGGFLGAGKTTFVLEQLKSAGGKVAVLVNEFGKLGMDGDLIRLKSGIEVVELPGGCICCSQRLGLVSSILGIAEEISPDLLLIEPSGVAEVSELLQVLSDPSLYGVIDVSAVVTVIDAETFLEFSEPEAFGLFFLDQVRSADLILVNKCDLVGADDLKAIGGRLALHNPDAAVVRTKFCRMPGPLPQVSMRRTALAKNTQPLEIECLSVIPDQPFSEERFLRFVTELGRGRFGRIMRGKGFIDVAGRGALNLQIVSGKVKVRRWNATVTQRLILIGFALKSEELDLFLREC